MIANEGLLDVQLEDDTPVVSVILPVYNGEEYLAEAIDSILDQTYWNFELIIINDGSTDGSQKILDDYVARDSRILVFSRENKGLAYTLNEAIDLARGKWIARMDQDDISLPGRLKQQVSALEKSNADLCGSCVKFFGKGRNRIWRGLESDQEIKKDLLFKSSFVHPSVMIKSDVIKNHKYDVQFENAEDYDLWVRLAISGKIMINIPEVLLLYRRHSAQVSNRLSSRQKILGEIIQRNYWLHISSFYELEPCEMESILGFIGNQKHVNMSYVQKAFIKILRMNVEKARSNILSNIYICSLKADYQHRSVIACWTKLNFMFTTYFPLNKLMSLYAFQKLQLLAKLFRVT